MGVSIWRGKFNKSSGKVTFDASPKTGNVQVQVDVNSIDFGHEKMNEFALTADWLNAAKFPTMSYKGALVFKGENPVAVEGQLTLLGVTKPLKLTLNKFQVHRSSVLQERGLRRRCRRRFESGRFWHEQVQRRRCSENPFTHSGRGN